MYLVIVESKAGDRKRFFIKMSAPPEKHDIENIIQYIHEGKIDKPSNLLKRTESLENFYTYEVCKTNDEISEVFTCIELPFQTTTLWTPVFDPEGRLINSIGEYVSDIDVRFTELGQPNAVAYEEGFNSCKFSLVKKTLMKYPLDFL